MVTRKLLLSAFTGVMLSVLAGGVAYGDDEKGTAVIKGRVLLDAPRPKMKAVKMSGDAVCTKGKKKPDPASYVFKDGSLPYVFVWVKSGINGKYGPPTEPVFLDQSGCMFKPHVFGMVTGQELRIKNSDPTSHNVHSLPKKNTEFNFSQPSQGMEKSLTGRDTFTRREVMIRFKCDVHSWMSAYCGVVPHPFFGVSGKNGAFEITELPAGEYEIEAWHEKYGKTTQTVTVADGETKEIEIKFAGDGKAEADAAPRTIHLASMPVDRDGATVQACCAPEASAKTAP